MPELPDQDALGGSAYEHVKSLPELGSDKLVEKQRSIIEDTLITQLTDMQKRMDARFANNSADILEAGRMELPTAFERLEARGVRSRISGDPGLYPPLPPSPLLSPSGKCPAGPTFLYCFVQ